MPRDIPGFYYDEVKKKYFKIEKNHIAVPGSAEYTADAVKRRKLDEEIAKDLEHLERLEKGRIRRSLTEPLLGGTLLREYGTSRDYSSTATQAYVGQWEGKEILHPESGASRRLRRLHRVTTSSEQIAAFDWDPIMEELFIVIATKGATLTAAFPSDATEDQEVLYERDMGIDICALHGLVNSISFDPESRLVLATWQTTAATNLYTAICLSFGDNASHDYDDYFHTASTWTVPGPQGRPRDQFDNGITLWTSTAAPAASPYLFAVGTSSGIFMLDENLNDLSCLQSTKQRMDESCEFFAVEFMSHNPSILLAGKRNGEVNLMDLRLPQAGYASGNAGVFHSASVAHVKEVNEHQIVVSGLESTLCQYDLRFCGVDKQQNSLNKGMDKAAAQGRTRTKSLFEYTGHQNQEHRDAGLAVDTEAGLVAAAQVGGSGAVKVFSSTNGEMIRTLDATEVGSSIDSAYVKAMRFLPDRGEKGMKSLWVAKGSKMVRYAT